MPGICKKHGLLGCFEKIAICIMKGLKQCISASKLLLMFGVLELKL